MVAAQARRRAAVVPSPFAGLIAALGTHARPDERLARHTTFRIGGPADVWAEAQTTATLVDWVRLARSSGVPVLVLGNGSNVLVLDGGVHGLVIGNRADTFELRNAGADRAVLHAAAGAALPLIANRLSRQGWSGLEWAIGIPGSIGGAVVGNAGAHGGSMADGLIAATVLDEGGALVRLDKTDMRFDYRTSRFKRTHAEIVLEVDLELRRDDAQACIERMSRYTEHRRRTQPTDASVGSMFKNPPGDFSGRLIEQAGLKGRRVGGVAISQVHANFFVNDGGATARDVLELVRVVRDTVREKFGITLELEIEIIGVDSRETVGG